MKPCFSPSCDRSCMKMADRFASRRYSLKNKLGDWMIKQSLKLVIAKYRDLSVSCRSIRILLIYGLFLIITNYWTRLSKISWFVSGKQINYYSAEANNRYLPQPNNNWSARHWQITDHRQNIVICQWRELLATDKSRYFAQPGSIIIGIKL